MTSFFIILFGIIITTLLLLSWFFPGINVFTLFDSKKKYFNKAWVDNDQLILEGLRNRKMLPISEINKLSMGPSFLRGVLQAAGMFTIQIDAVTESLFIFQSPLNLFAPALSKEVINKLLTLNSSIKLDFNLEKYSNGSLADIYINRDQIKRGFLALFIIIVLFLVAYFL